MLFKVILSFETFPAYFTTKSQFRTFVRSFMDHQIIRFREASLTIFANEFAFRSHFSPKLSTAHFVINLHYSEHLDLVYLLYFYDAYLNQRY